MVFARLTSLFLRIEQETSRLVITQLLAELFAQVPAEDASFVAYFCLGELYPSYCNKTTQLADKTAVKVIAALLCQDAAAVRAGIKQAGDVGTYLRMMMPRDLGRHAPASVRTVKEVLHAIVDTTGAGSQEAKEQQLLSLLGMLDADEACFVMRSVTGTLRLGFSDMTMLDAYSWMLDGSKKYREDLEHCYNVTADIGHVLYVLKTEGIDGIRRATMIPGVPVRPAAADRMPDSAAVFAKLGPCVAQQKLDGFRVQIHRWRDELGIMQTRFFSRNLHDMSSMFPDLVRALDVLTVDSVIMEGEAIVRDPATGTFVPFQETVKRKRKHGVDAAAEQLPLTLYVFDLLYVHGESLLECSHVQRRQKLCALIPAQGQVQVIEEVAIHSARDLALYFEYAMGAGLEGVVVKNPAASYQPGKRSSNWIKLKREERGELADTLDCVILGYYAGAGKRTLFGIGAFLVGVYNPTSDCFETIAKIGTGLSDAEWRELKGRCDAAAVPAQPHNVCCAPDLAPDVWVAPMVVCCVRADDITRSPLHTAGKADGQPGYALRFPRIMGYRPDKGATDATTPAEVVALYQLQDLKHKKG